jgi:hypothetical protein
MSTDPGPTRKADGSSDASGDDIVELLVEDDSATREAHPQGDQALDDSLDVMLETPGPAAVGTFMPPPPLLPNATDENSSETEDRENAEGAGQSNLAYEDLLAKLVLPSENTAQPGPRLPVPEPSLPEPLLSAPAPEAVSAPARPTPIPLPVFTPAPTPAPALFDRPSSTMSLAAGATDDRTLVTENPLLAEEQEAAAREGRTTSRDQAPRVQDDLRFAGSGPIPPLVAVNVATRTKMAFFIAGNLAMLLCMVMAVAVFKIFIQAPAAPPAVIMPAAAPQPSPTPPAKVEPLPTPPHAGAVPVPVAAPAPEPAAEPPAENPLATQPAATEVARPAPKAHRPTSVHKTAATHAPKPAPVAKAAPAPVAKPAKAAAPAKKGKAGGYADPFDN